MTEHTLAADASRCDASLGQCHLCGDEAVVGRVLKVDAHTRTATVDLPGGPATVALDLVDAAIGDDVLVHLGFAIERMSVS
jgi:HupF/HypC family